MSSDSIVHLTSYYEKEYEKTDKSISFDEYAKDRFNKAFEEILHERGYIWAKERN